MSPSSSVIERLPISRSFEISACAREPGEEDRHALLAARRVVALHLRDHLGKRIPLRQLQPRAHAPPRLGAVKAGDALLVTYLAALDEAGSVFRIDQLAHCAALVRADDHMRAAVVARHDRLQQRLARPGQAHCQRQRGEQHVMFGEVRQPLFPAAQPRVEIHVVRLSRANDGQHQQVGIRRASTALGRLVLQTVQRIARQKSRHPPPAHARELLAHLGRS
jgi:hypothetical protein